MLRSRVKNKLFKTKDDFNLCQQSYSAISALIVADEVRIDG
jgi:hypothetical protein